MKFFKLITFCTLIFFNYQLKAESNAKPKMFLMADGRKDSIVLRWAPVDIKLWRQALQYGYVIERFNFKINDEKAADALQNPILLTPKPIKPLPREQMEQLIKQDSLVKIIYEAVYNFSETKNTKPLSKDEELRAFFAPQKTSKAKTLMDFCLYASDLSEIVSIAAGLRFVDTTVQKGYEYVYRVRIANQTDTKNNNYAVVVKSASEPFLTPKIYDLSGTTMDRQATMRWGVKFFRGIYTAYWLEKSSDQKQFFRVSKRPLSVTSAKKGEEVLEVTRKDSLARNGVKYYYRVCGITPFATLGPYSDTIAVQGVTPIDGEITIKAITVVPNRLDTASKSVNIKIDWLWKRGKPAKRVTKDELNGFRVERSEYNEGPYKALNDGAYISPDTVVTFLDTKPLDKAFYRIKLKGKHEEQELTSMPRMMLVPDTVPPAPPTGLKGHVDSSGIVRIYWDKNKEPDMYKYYIHRSTGGYGFSSIASATLNKTEFLDTVNMRSINLITDYRIVAVDNHMNRSTPSKVLRLKRPDLMPPVPPVMYDVKKNRQQVALLYERSASWDVQTYYFIRTNVEDKKVDTISRKPDGEDRNRVWFSDNSRDVFKSYAYQALAVDSAGNKAASLPYEILAELRPCSKIKELQVKKDEKKKCLLLEWQPEINEADSYIIYRSAIDKPLAFYTKINASKQAVMTFEDKDIEGFNYQYAVQSHCLDKPKGMMSATVKP